MGVKAHNDDAKQGKNRRKPIEQIAALAHGGAYNYVSCHRSGVLLLLAGLAVACLGLGLLFFWIDGPAPIRAIAGALGFGLPALWILFWAFERLDL